MKSTYIDTLDGGMFCNKEDLCEVVTKGEGDSGAIVLLVSTEAVDSDGDIVHQGKTKHGAGWVLDRYNKAPAITWQHDMMIPNLSGPKTRAKVQRHETKGRGLHLNPLQFDSGDEFATFIEGKIRRDSIKESSVGFKILAREARKGDSGERVGLDIYEQELVEVAIANRGANPETEVLAKRFLSNPRVLKEVEDGGSPEIVEMKEYIEELARKVESLETTISRFSDVHDEEAQETLLAKENKAKLKTEEEDTLESMLAALTGQGISRTGN